MMKCIGCDNQKELKSISLKSYKYKECGLDNVILHGINSYRCDKCGEEYINLGNIQKLNTLIASVLIKKEGLLNGKEIKFLRKHLGYSGQFFSELVKYDPSHLSRVEAEKLKPTAMFDMVIRFLVHEKLPDRNYVLQDLFIENKLIPFLRLDLTATGQGRWKIEPAA